MHNKNESSPSSPSVLDNRCLGARARWKLKLKLPWNFPGLQGAVAGAVASHGVLCGYKRGGRCRGTDQVATWYSMFCRPAGLQACSSLGT